MYSYNIPLCYFVYVVLLTNFQDWMYRQMLCFKIQIYINLEFTADCRICDLNTIKRSISCTVDCSIAQQL
jgi:hypothetical protein